MTRTAFVLSSLAALALACGNDSTATDAGQDATSSDVATKDVAADAPKQDGSITDAGANDAQPPSDAAPEAAASDCDGGCTLFSYACASGPYQPCTCLSLSVSEPTPQCDGGTVTCFKDPCSGKKAACVSGQCVVQ